ncbi:bifunctional cytidylyltransferase/SDR family oxidoreductase [Streptosporangiaceae bacterium NEAU-GS5]|nr:bifunctional cytidylyltransferase/SDR family oxidoreductase [Streptosporangiaceae bacterium NEAU-GS5]
MSRPVVGVVLAGGVGQRVGLDTPKQLLKIAGKTIIEHTLGIFESAPEVDEILVVMTSGFLGQVEEIVAKAGLSKVKAVVEGGASRTDSTWRAIEALGDRDCDVLLHDAVRPLLDRRIIGDCVTALGAYEAVDVVIPSADTVVVAGRGPHGEVIKDIPERSALRRGQTPQCFRLATLKKAYLAAFADPRFATSPPTDDCGVVLRYLPDVPIGLVDGSEHNMKVTHPVDVYLADRLFQLASSVAPELPAETSLAGRTLVVFGGSYGIGADVAALARRHGAEVHCFSRSMNGVRVEDAASVEAALAKVPGPVDYVVNTAGVLHTGELADLDEDTVADAVNVNYLGPINVARASIPYLTRTQGQLLLYTSSSYTRGRANYSLYSSAKAAVVNLTQALADEWTGRGVRVNCVNPERTSTPMRLRAFGQEPPGSLLTSLAVAETSLAVLVSDLTGQIIDVRIRG